MIIRLALVLIFLFPPAIARGAQEPLLDFAIPNGHFYTQTNGTAFGTDSKGYSITDDHVAPMWREYSRLGGVDVLGYPVSRRFIWAGYVSQATQKVVMQWRPEVGQVWFANVFDAMSTAGKDGWLQVVRQTPKAFDTTPDTGLPWSQVADRHWKLLDNNESIKSRYWSDADPLNHYGLPLSFVDLSNVFVVRAQRAVFQYWKQDVPWAKAGTVTVANGGDVAKEAGLYPASAVALERNPNDVRIRWAYYVGYDKKSLESLTANIRRLDVVSPFYFAVDSQGNIADTDEAAVTRLIKDNKVKILPTVRSSPQYDEFHTLISNSAMRAKIINRIMELIDAHGYDGINIDFEGINYGDRQNLSSFMVELAARMRPRGKIVSMAVAAKERDLSTGWAAGYDYAALGQSNDLILVMAYGYRTASNPEPGSTAPMDWVDRSMAYAASQIPANKLLVGIAWYGYDYNKTAGPPATSVRYSDIVEIFRQTGALMKYSERDQTAYFTYVLGGQSHEVWFEDVRSFKAKLALVDKYGLAGAGGWRLGHEDPGIWELFK
ncbi:MAG: glycosyl hydrolase family 18 protein [Dehalococcoidia bacterium]|nr:glycosyl hydrolase family 18 protein [Dehalococcoidia bacterium]